MIPISFTSAPSDFIFDATLAAPPKTDLRLFFELILTIGIAASAIFAQHFHRYTHLKLGHLQLIFYFSFK